MVFWGIEVKPGQEVPYDSDEVRGRLHITQATLGAGSSSKKTALQCVVGENSPIVLCSLLPDKVENCPLNLEFEEEGLVSFSVVGPRSVHLSGFIETDGQEGSGDDEYDSDPYGDGIAEMDSDEASSDYSGEDGEEDEFSDEDDEFVMLPPSPVPNSGVVIEEIEDDEKPVTGVNASKQAKKKKGQLSGKAENDDLQKQIVVKHNTGVPMSESEDEDGFPVSDPIQSKSKVEKMDEGKRNVKSKALKKKRSREETDTKADTNSDTLPKRDANQPSNSSLPAAATAENNDQPKKKKKNSERPSKEAKTLETLINATDEKIATTNNNGAHPATNEDKLAEKKKKKKSKAEKGEENAAVSAKPIEKENEGKGSNVREFPNGLVIEDLKMGKPDGKRASPGKQVFVTYIGKLKKNGSIFDSNVGRAPFKFRLGVGQVIKGWDVGVKGMRVGDKRRLTIPPSMGYGAQGAGPKIPPNSWLMFDVELLDVK